MAMRASGMALLVLSMLSGCAASDFGADDAPGRSRFEPSGAFGAYLTGRFAAQESDLETAASKLEQAARDSGTREVATQAFIAAVMAGRPEAAQLAAGLPDNPVAQLVLADEDARAGRWEDAEARYSVLPQQGMTQAMRPLLVAWAESGSGRTAAALGTLQPFIDAGRLRAITNLHAALIADLGGQADKAARLYRAAQVEYGALNLRLGVILASWQARRGSLVEAQQTIRELTGSNGDLATARLALEADVSRHAVRNATDGIAETYLAMAATLRQQNAADLARLLLRRALVMRPDFTAARLLLSEMQTLEHQDDAALGTLAPVAADDPLAAVVRLRQAALQEELGHTAAADKMLETMAEQFPDRPEPLAQLGDSLRRSGRFSEAVKVYDRAVARLGTPNRQSWPLFYERGVAHERAGQWPEAEADFQFALRLAPDQPSILNYLGYAWTEQGRNLSEARQMIERAVELRPNDGAFIDSLGWAQLRQGDGPGALKNLEKAVELQPEDPVINGHLGDALAAVGRWREAEFQWRRALNLKPEPDDARRIESKLASLPAATAVSTVR